MSMKSLTKMKSKRETIQRRNLREDLRRLNLLSDGEEFDVKGDTGGTTGIGKVTVEVKKSVNENNIACDHFGEKIYTIKKIEAYIDKATGKIVQLIDKI
jgi:hypothetical protein